MDLRHQIYDKFNGHCAYCGEPIHYKEMHVDHIIPQRNFHWHVKNKYRLPAFLSHLNENDVNHIDNKFPSCRKCNSFKKAFDLETFRSELSEQVARLNKYSCNYRMAKKFGLITEIKKDIVFYFEHI